jgi:hypothetical protein
MARNTEKQNTTTYEPKAPDFLAWHITQKGPKSFWNKVGAAWKHKCSATMRMRYWPRTSLQTCDRRSQNRLWTRTRLYRP